MRFWLPVKCLMEIKFARVSWFGGEENEFSVEEGTFQLLVGHPMQMVGRRLELLDLKC